jgi:hypothetical protein
MDLRTVARAGEKRRRLLAEADQQLELIVDELLSNDGDRPNIRAAANVSGIARTTLQRALRARRTSTAG